VTEYQLECYFDSHPCIHLFEQPLVYYDMQTIAVFIPAAMQEYKGSDYVAIKARYSLTVLKMPLNPNSINQYIM